LYQRFCNASQLQQLELVGLAASVVIPGALALGLPLVRPYLAVSIVAANVRVAAPIWEIRNVDT
jgi:hypothetical protein